MWALYDLADFAEISADFDHYILVIFFEKSSFFTKFGLWDKEVGPTSKKIFFYKFLHYCIIQPQYRFDREISDRASLSQN